MKLNNTSYAPPGVSHSMGSNDFHTMRHANRSMMPKSQQHEIPDFLKPQSVQKQQSDTESAYERMLMERSADMKSGGNIPYGNRSYSKVI